MTWDDIALVVPHQANYRIVESAVKRMGITDEKVFLTLKSTVTHQRLVSLLHLQRQFSKAELKRATRLYL